ncbi:MAG: DASS family sodium-coupled anion symporter [Capnocytophaga sp.]|jgi:hypothetical protein|uniref:DASS family sodium-coupled anion symporter n=1 Tax=Capnocytophaga gingivalis TaxID=1017 RepID=A0ABU5Z5Q5_9FLAO|nr:DASS family sodium-coupled anion symporter [Capnocytophaga gingivalis]MEB3073974.1 DASS family sodium-coupled anion symporter [Capnocytophaga gingivalis]RKW05618.1 MAG: DASS family sodium-coupled anion symporter [Capnocytophaga sp.]
MKTEFITAKRALILLVAVLFSGALLLWLPYEAKTNKGLALLVLVAILWLTEVIPITITAIAVPILSIILGLVETKPALQHFANPTIFLFFGGFALAASLSVNKLDKYIAHKVLSLARGNFLVAILLLFLVTAGLSMGISNTATAAMMIPLGIGLLKGLPYEENKGSYWFVILGITYSASIGGMGTLVGSPPNAIVSSNLGVTFQEWLWYGMPVVAGLLPLTILTLYFLFRPNLKVSMDKVKGDDNKNEPLNRKQWGAIIIFALTALFWIFSTQMNPIFSNLFGLEKIGDFDSVIALTAAILVCTFNIVSWKDIQDNTDWGVLLLFGGGLTLSAVLGSSGASKALVESIVELIRNQNHFVIGLLVATFIVFLTEFTSNTASAALLVPIFISIAEEIGVPAIGLAMIIGIGASCAFMLPVATPPNAIAFGTGLIPQKVMLKAGFWLNIISILFISIIGYYFWGGQ